MASRRLPFPGLGSSVVVDRTKLATGGFVAIHDASLLDGAVFDSVRGTSEYLSAGTHTNVTIETDAIGQDGTFIAMPHLDTNGNEEYDFVTSEGQADGPYTNAPADSTAGPIVVAAAEVTVEMGDMDDGSSTPDDDQSTPDGSSGDGAGFGLVAALLAIVALAFLARRN